MGDLLNRVKTRLATPFVRRLLNRPTIYETRKFLAERYIQGCGVEIGGLNAPLPVPSHARVRYADFKPVEALESAYSDIPVIQAPDILTDLESLVGVPDASQDFLIANHVLEHVEDPLRAMRSVRRVLKAGGIAFVALPDKRYTFDAPRSVTPLEHLIRDFNEGPEWSAPEHYRDWAENVDEASGSAIEERAAELLAIRENIHFHVWDFEAMKAFFRYVSDTIGFDILHGQQNRNEGVWILRKQ